LNAFQLLGYITRQSIRKNNQRAEGRPKTKKTNKIMGNSTSNEENKESGGDGGDHTAGGSHSQLDGFTWPENLYLECRDMANASFLVYAFAYILDTARKVEGPGLQGLVVDETGHVIPRSSSSSTSALSRTFTPGEVLQIIQDNQQVLAQYYPSTFQDPTMVIQSLQLLEERAAATTTTSGSGGTTPSPNSRKKKKRPLELVEFDDHHQHSSLVYAVTKDDVNKRITLCFRGTDNQLAFHSNWAANFNIWKVAVPVPTTIQDVVSVHQIWLHKGFYGTLL
jgi:hypothetical protein